MGWFYLILAILVAALVLQAGLLAFAMYVLIGVLLVSRHLSREWIGSLEVERSQEALDALEVGESVEIRLKLRNRGKWSVTWVLIEDLFPEPALRQRPPRVRITGKRIRLTSIAAGKSATLTYTIECLTRGYYQIGPTLLETGDVFGLHRRHRIVAKPLYLMVYPKIVPLPRYDITSQRPIGEVNLAPRLFEDPTRNAGVRPYQMGDPLQRVHWRATARTGELHSRAYEPTSLAGASILLDFHSEGYHKRGEPVRSELAISVAAALAYAVSILNQQVGFFSNGRDAADRLRQEIALQSGSDETGETWESREAARSAGSSLGEGERLEPVAVATRRGIEQFQRIREALARLELTDGLSFIGLVADIAHRLPRDASIVALLPTASIDTATMLGNLRRRGFAISVILLAVDEDDGAVFYGRLLTESIRDVRFINSESDLTRFGGPTAPMTSENVHNLDIDLMG